MQDYELLQDGLALMALGMGVVFVFLTILVISVTLMSKLIGRFQPAPTAAEVSKKSPSSSAPASQNDEMLAVISAAVHRYRSTRRR
ncbi:MULTISPECIES: OadG family protein [unclassified Halomonas]|uniref:OadG family protein n=1 Tax=Halomonadaceae TaxID=28256 RepID=UPI00022D26D9|nr:OadG family transporter subunit [Halomonas sp. HAL1]EHA16111.1 Na+-transporting oxaloacetate decarboxylase, gamma subunit [Halomonas sp. HAL1]WKV93722.1 OadG family transporter subunit [Halomonas sp. HAL1]|tara:strand:+ start:1519 stop:1776 length:258 start_codon:yes stop_codon:yes gene_type:complete